MATIPHTLEVHDIIDAPPESCTNFSPLSVSAHIADKVLATRPYLPNVAGSEAPITTNPDSIPITSPEKFISCRIGHHMHRPLYRCRADAYAQAYDDCQHSGYQVYNCDPGYRHRIVHACLTRPATLWTLFNNVLSLGGGQSCRPHDEVIHVPMSCAKEGHTMPCHGTLSIGCGETATTCDQIFHGRYDLKDCAVGNSHEICIPLQPQRIVNHCVKLGLATPHLYMRCRRVSDQDMCLEGARIACYLRPQAGTLIDPRSHIRRCASSGCSAFDREPHPPCMSYSDDSDREHAQPNQHLEEAKTCVSESVTNLVGPASWRLVAHIGRTMIANCGTDVTSSSYRMGGVTEVMFVAALLKRFRGLDIHSSEVTEQVLRGTGAMDVLSGLKQCYAQVGDRSVPSIFQLINHTSMLPANSTFTLSQFVRALRGEDSPGELNALERQAWVGRMLRECRPLGRPGVYHSHSHINSIILRYMLPDWRTDDCTELRGTCSDMGMPAACLSIHANNHAACEGPITCDAELKLHPTWKHRVFAHSSGLSMRTTELAAFLCGHGFKHSWTDGTECSEDYSFVPSTCMPAVSIHRKTGLSYGWGWFHGSVLQDVKAFGSRGLRVMLRCGETLSGHTTVACRVPSLGLSFALNLGAPLSRLTGVSTSDSETKSHTGLLEPVGKIIRALLTPMHSAGSLHSDRARFWNPTLNEALCQVPPACPNYGSFMRECAHKLPYFAASVPSLKPLIDAGDMVSATEGNNGPTSYKLSIREKLMERSELAVALNDTRQLVRYELVIKTSSGEIITQPLAFDPDACATSDDAALFARLPRSRRSGCFRTVCPHTGLLHNYVGIYRVKFGDIKEHAVLYDGRVFLCQNMYEAIRRRHAPTEREALVDSISNAASSKAEPQPSMGLGALASELSKVQHSEAGVPGTTPTERIRGRGGGGGWVAPFVAGSIVGGVLNPYRPYPAYGPYAWGYNPYYANPCPPGLAWDPYRRVCV